RPRGLSAPSAASCRRRLHSPSRRRSLQRYTLRAGTWQGARGRGWGALRLRASLGGVPLSRAEPYPRTRTTCKLGPSLGVDLLRSVRAFDEPISPELVLVSPPEVVARARALLLETELACSANPHERGPEQKSAVSLPLPAPAVDRAPVVRSGRTRRSSGRVGVALVTCALAVAAALVVYERRSASAPSSSPTSEALGAQSSIRNSAGATAPRAERRTAGRPAARPAQTKPAQRRRARVGPAVKTRHAARVAARPEKERLPKSAPP